MSKQSLNELEFWQQRWVNHDTPWDLRGYHKYLPDLYQHLCAIRPALFQTPHQAFVPACGTAHDAAALAQRGISVVAEDIVPEAIEAASKLYAQQSGVRLRVGDSLITPPEEENHYDLIYDRAALCAMQPPLRQPFIDSCMSKLKPGGLFSSILFGDIREPHPPGGGPPFAIGVGEFLTLLGQKGELLVVEERSSSIPESRIATEILIVAIKR